MAYPERIETKRLLLRRWEPTDGPGMAAIWREPRIWNVMRPRTPFDPDHWRRMLDRQLDHSVAVATRLGMHHARDVRHPDLGEDLRVYALPRTAWSPSSRRGASPQSISSR